MNVSQLCDLFLSHAHGYYRKPKSKRLTREYSLIRSSLQPLRQVAGAMAVDDVTAVTVAKARQWILDNLPGNCRNTVNKKASRMVRIFRWGSQPERSLVPALVYAQLVTIQPLPYGRCSARETQGLQDVSRDRINDLMATLFDPPKHPGNADKVTMLARRRLATMIELQLETGMRPGELCSMTVEAIDKTGNRGTGGTGGPDGIWLYRPDEHKTEHRGKERIVVLFEPARNLITRWLTTNSIKAGRLFEMRVDSFRTSVQRALKRAGLESFTPQQLRHTMGTEVRREYGLDAAQVLLGHSSARTTEGYAHVRLEEVIKSMQG